MTPATLLFVALGIGSTAYAKPQTYLVYGGADPSGQYAESSRAARDSSQALGREVHSMSTLWNRWGRSSWNSVIDRQMAGLGAQPATQGSLVIDLSGPGRPPEIGPEERPEDPRVILRAGVELGNGEFLSYERLKTLIRDQVPPGRKVKIIANSDFSGAAHQIAFETENVCVIARTDQRSLLVDRRHSHNYPSQAWKALASKDREVDGRRGISLIEGHLGGLGHDPWNMGRTQSSAFAYVDFMTRQGAFAPDQGDGDRDRLLDEIEETFRQGERITGGPPHGMRPACQYEGPLRKLFADYDQIATRLGTRLSEGFDPPELGHLYGYASATYTILRRDFEQVIRKSLNSYKTLQDEYDSMPAEQQKKRLAEFTKKMDKHETELMMGIAKLRGRYEFIRQLERAREFMRTAPPEQKAKFKKLLDCETEAL